MKHLKKFNESQNTSLVQRLVSVLNDKMDYDFDRDYDDVYCHMTYGDDGTWTKLIDSLFNIINPELASLGSNINKEDFERHISDIIPSGFTIGYQDENFIESKYDSDSNDFDLVDEDDRSQRSISINYENIADAILKKFGMKHLRKYESNKFSLGKEDKKLEEIYDKISDAAYSMQTFGTFNKQASFINGAKWAIHNLTSDDIDYIKKHGDKDDQSFFGIK
jgi:hypothetical protein